ncbi:hypothetical protein HDZ31DRAFT_78906, partial [Schizophyllum fasciatum]
MNRTGSPVVPRYALEDPTVVAIIESEIVAKGRHNVTLEMLEHLIDNRTLPAAAATAPNNIPVASRVNAVPSGAYISPNSSYEADAPRSQPPVPVNMIRYTPDDVARSYASTGLPGRVTHVANVRSTSRLSRMGPPPAPTAHAAPVRGYVSATFEDSDEDPGYDDDYLAQAAPPRRAPASPPRGRSPPESVASFSRRSRSVLRRSSSMSRDRSLSRARSLSSRGGP